MKLVKGGVGLLAGSAVLSGMSGIQSDPDAAAQGRMLNRSLLRFGSAGLVAQSGLDLVKKFKR